MPMIHVVRAGQTQSPKQPNPGFVYLIRFFPGVYKIGCSTDPQRRMATLQRKRKHLKLELIHSVWSEFYTDAESYMHRIFADNYIDGEYYFLTDEDVAKFKAIEFRGR